MAVSAMVAMGVLPPTKRNSSGAYPRMLVKALLKMGHSARPNGRSSVGAPKTSQSGVDMAGSCVECVVRAGEQK